MNKNDRAVYQYSVTDQYDVEHDVTGYSERFDGTKLIIDTVSEGEKIFPGAKVRQKELQPSDGPMPFFLNGEQLG